MTTAQFFKKYPGAQEVLKVGKDLFFANFEHAAQAHALSTGLPLERIGRPSGKGSDSGSKDNKPDE